MESERWVRSGQVCLKNFYIFCIFLFCVVEVGRVTFSLNRSESEQNRRWRVIGRVPEGPAWPGCEARVVIFFLKNIYHNDHTYGSTNAHTTDSLIYFH